MSDAKPAPPNVYEVYDAVGECAKAYHHASVVAMPYSDLKKKDERYAELMARLDDAADELQGHINALGAVHAEATVLVASIRRDIHRACAHRDLVEWGDVTASSVAEAMVALAGRVLEVEWDRDGLAKRNRTACLRREPKNHERVVAMLNLEAARVVEIQERKGADLSRLSPVERRVYCAIEVHGPINEKGINQLLYGNPTKGDTRRTAAPMVRHGILDATSEGYVIRQPGNIVRTDVS